MNQGCFLVLLALLVGANATANNDPTLDNTGNDTSIRRHVYSRSSYTPTIGDGINTFTTSTAYGGYESLNGIKQVTGHIIWTDQGNVGSSNLLKISLPSTIVNSADYNRMTFSIGKTRGLVYNGAAIQAIADKNTNFLYLYSSYLSGATPSPVVAIDCLDAGEIQWSGFIKD